MCSAGRMLAPVPLKSTGPLTQLSTLTACPTDSAEAVATGAKAPALNGLQSATAAATLQFDCYCHTLAAHTHTGCPCLTFCLSFHGERLMLFTSSILHFLSARRRPFAPVPLSALMCG